MKEIKKVFAQFLSGRNLRVTPQRSLILDVFLSTERHLTCEELYNLVKDKDKSIGWSTVFRTLKLLCESNIAGEVDLGDGLIRFEHKYGHEHHDHLICSKCGKLVEIVEPKIEKLQKKMAEIHDFTITGHKMDIFGICKECRGEN
ncbi:MAG: Fur family transcriptional regulator [Fidelibacterota bacterium]